MGGACGRVPVFLFFVAFEGQQTKKSVCQLYMCSNLVLVYHKTDSPVFQRVYYRPSSVIIVWWVGYDSSRSGILGCWRWAFSWT